MTWLLTGGAGYIGAHIVRAMREAGDRVVVLDDLSTGIARARPGRRAARRRLDRSTPTRCAPRSRARRHRRRAPRGEEAGRRVRRAAAATTTARTSAGLRVLLRGAAGGGRATVVFSSSAAVYGMPDVDLVTEETPCRAR